MDPLQESAAIFLGASSWPRHAQFKPHPAFRNSAEGFRDYLQSADLQRTNILWLFDHKLQPSHIISRISNFLKKLHKNNNIKTILLYYVGHGDYINGNYVLTPACFSRETPSLTALPVREIAHVLGENAPDKRHIVIVDACYAAGATQAFLVQSPEEPAQVMAEQFRARLSDVTVERGTSLFCAAGARKKAKIPIEGSYTMFTGALLSALRKGHSHRDTRRLLSLSTLAFLVEDEIKAAFGGDAVRPELHTPRQDQGDIRDLEFFPNPAWNKPEPPPVVPPVVSELSSSVGHGASWDRRSIDAGWYELLEIQKEIDRSGDLRQTHKFKVIYGPRTGEIARIPYGFRAEPQFGTCALREVKDLDQNWSMLGNDLPPPATRLQGAWDLSRPAEHSKPHPGLVVESHVFNSYAVTAIDAELRGHSDIERSSFHASYPVKHLRVSVRFPKGCQPTEVMATAFFAEDMEKPAVEWRQAVAETARISHGLFFADDRGIVVLTVDRALPDYNYLLRWRLPSAPPPPTLLLNSAKMQSRSVLGLSASCLAELEGELRKCRDELAQAHFHWKGKGFASLELGLLAYDEARKLVCEVASTRGPRSPKLELPWGTGVVGWVMRRRRPVFVDTQDRHTAGIYRVIEGSAPDRHLLCVPCFLPVGAELSSAECADPGLPCLVAALSCGDERGNLGVLKGAPELFSTVSTGLSLAISGIINRLSVKWDEG